MEITKTQLIEIWESYCDTAQDPDAFYYYNTYESQSYGMRINDNISLTIDFDAPQNSYTITLIFSDLIRYKTFNFTKEEYGKLLETWESGDNKATIAQKDKKISEGLAALERLLNLSNISETENIHF